MPRSDVIIIGAGISGCATAAHLLRLNPGLKVTLLDRRRLEYSAGRRAGPSPAPPGQGR